MEYESPDEKIVKSFESVMIRTFLFYASILGKDGLEEACNRYLRSLDGVDPVSRRRNLAFFNKLNQLSISDHLPDSSNSFGLWRNCGRLYFKL